MNGWIAAQLLVLCAVLLGQGQGPAVAGGVGSVLSTEVAVDTRIVNFLPRPATPEIQRSFHSFDEPDVAAIDLRAIESPAPSRDVPAEEPQNPHAERRAALPPARGPPGL